MVTMKYGANKAYEFKEEFTILVPEKFNRDPSDPNRNPNPKEEYYEYDNAAREKYTVDNLADRNAEIINQYLAENNYSTVIIVGGSEGACVLPLVYENIKNKQDISGLISIAYGGLSMYEQMKIFADSPLKSQYSSWELQKLDMIKECNDLHPNSIDEQFGVAYGFFNYKPFDDYKNIDIPVLFIHGELDGNVPVESTRYIQENLPENPFEYIYLAHSSHTFISRKDRKEALSKARAWINRL
jgi:pimeloyl-ACP methyl ester carboxylesterase